MLATTTTPEKIVCVDEMSIPPLLQKNNDPFLSGNRGSWREMLKLPTAAAPCDYNFRMRAKF